MTKALCLILLASRASALLAQGPSECGTNLNQLVVGSDFNGSIGYLPFETDIDGVIEGFDAAVACEVAHRLGFGGVNFQQIPFPDLLTELTASPSSIDVVISALSLTDTVLATPGAGFVKYNDDSLGIVVNLDDVGTAPLTNTDPAAILTTLNDFGVTSGTNVVIGVMPGSRQEAIITSGAYSNLAASLFDANQRDLEAALTALKSDTNQTIALFVDGATAVTLAAADPTLFAINNVVDTTNSEPSQGYGIAVNSACCQLYANVQQAINDMEADGTLARLRAEFIGIPTTFTPATGLTPAACAGTVSDINSNAIANFLFSKYCPCIVGTTVI